MIGVHLLGFEGTSNEKEIQSRTRQMLARALNMGRVIGFVGTGISNAYGYKDWKYFAHDTVHYSVKQIKKSKETDNIDKDTLNFLESYSENIKNRSVTSTVSALADRISLVLGICIESSERLGFSKNLRYHMAQAIRRKPYDRSHPIEKPDNNDGLDPLRLIIEELGIRRFLTTNYDLEIEGALRRTLGCRVVGVRSAENENQTSNLGWEKLAQRFLAEPEFVVPNARSLLFDVGRLDELVRFAVAAPDYDVGVFHLHGVSTEPESMIVTERDYQRFYLRDDPAHRSYREALDVAFSGNALLFMGVGMQENDLLRPLRQFVSERHQDAPQRPLFAICEIPRNRIRAQEWRQYLYTRFGVKVLYYPVKNGDRTQSFCKAVKDLANYRSTWWEDWQKKPRIRKPTFATFDKMAPPRGRPVPVVGAKVMVHHYPLPSSKWYESTEDEKEIRKYLDNEKKAAVVVVGAPGTGKGSLGVRLVRGNVHTGNKSKNNFDKKYCKRFFATTHFTNEFLSILDAAANFLGDGGSGGPAERFGRALQENRHLVVIGGLDRLLRPVPSIEIGDKDMPKASEFRLPIGRPINRDAETLLSIVEKIARVGPSHIVLTSSIWPLYFQGSAVRRLQLSGISKGAIEGHFKDLLKSADADDMITQLHVALQGHAYALSVVAQILFKDVPVDQRLVWLAQLVGRLTAADPPRRPDMAIDAAIRAHVGQHVGENATSRGLDPRSVLQRVALFTTPVEVRAVQASYPKGSKKRGVQTVLERLATRKLLLRIQEPYNAVAKHNATAKYRYTAHTVVRRHVLHALGALPDSPGEPQRFDLADFASEPAEDQPYNSAGHKLTTESADALLAQCEKFDAEELAKSRSSLRAVFGLLRSHWTATGIGRQDQLYPQETYGPRAYYDDYQRRLARLLNLIRGTHPDENWLDWLTEQDGGDNREEIEVSEGILYADELAWLYNELGLSAYCRGFLRDAYALFRVGQEVNRVAERGVSGSRMIQSEINLAIVWLELARLPRARRHLERALLLAKGHKGPGARIPRIHGYLGLVHHLSGENNQAEVSYKKAIKALQKIGDRRGMSVFMRNRCDLRRGQRDFEGAQRDLSDSIAAAESGRHLDLLHYARVAEAHFKLAANQPTPREFLEPSLEFARKAGIPKLESDVYRVQGIIALHEGEIQRAGRLTVYCLGLASALGMRLRLTASLVLMGQVAKARGERGIADRILRSAIALAERQGYQHQIEKAERELIEIVSAPT